MMKPNNRHLIWLVGTVALAAALLAAFGLILTPVAHAGTLTVTSTADSGPGSLRQAVLDADPGDVIDFYLAYPATITLTTDQILITESLTIVGPGPDLLSISGGGTTRIFDVSNPDGPEAITFALSGLTLRDGFSHHGAALHSDEKLFIENVVLVNNAIDGFEPCGGAIYVRENRPLLKNVVFEGNSSTWKGGGMCTSFAHPTLINTVFRANTSAVFGGGMFNGRGGATLINVLFQGNQADLGGAIANRESTLNLDNVTLSGNRAEQGGGIYNYPSYLYIRNSILWGNRATAYGHEIVHIDGGGALVTSSDVRGSGGSGAGWDSGLGTDGGGNLDLDPLFQKPISATVAPTGTGDYHLEADSPAIDSGDNALVPITSTTDLDGLPRVYGVVDMGAYEMQPVLSIAKTVTPTVEVQYHAVVTYSIVVSNSGSLSATGVLLTDRLPAEVTFARWLVEPPGAQVITDTLTWSGTVPAGNTMAFTFVATHTGDLGDVVTNVVTLTHEMTTGHAVAVLAVEAGTKLYLPLVRK